eukprot:10277464-Karenia_brevis.AAC.1
MTVDRQRVLRSTQRAMLRKILGSGRKVTQNRSEEAVDDSDDTDNQSEETAESDDTEPLLESWLDWMVRTTRASEAVAKNLQLQDWVETQKPLKWRLAGHRARRTDQRWSTSALNWLPTSGRRKPAHPRK